MKPIRISVHGHVNAAQDMAFQAFLVADLPTILVGRGPLPGVASVDHHDGGWNTVGQTRTLHLSDGSSLREYLTEVVPPNYFTYDIDQITSPLRFLVTGFHGEWRFDAKDSGTKAAWRYDFDPRSSLTRPLAALMLRTLWKPIMADALRRATLLAEQAPLSTDDVTPSPLSS